MSDPPVSHLSPDHTRTDLENLRSAHQALRSMTLRMHVLILVGLLAATVFTPLLHADDRRLDLFGALSLISTAPARLGSVADHPLALPAGLALIKVGLLSIMVGVVLALLGSRSLVRVPLRTRGAVMSLLTAAALVLGAASLVAGVALLPSPAPVGLGLGVVFAAVAGIWLWHGAWSLRQLDWDWTTP